MDNQETLNVLKGIGFSENESRVYLAVLELGPSSIWRISKKSGIKRPTCYFILGELALKSFASSVDDGKRIVYSVATPKQLMLAVNRRHDKFIESISSLEGLASRAQTKPVVQLYEGNAGITAVYDLTLNQPHNSEILIYGTATVEANYGQFIAEYLKERKKKGIKTRVLLADNEINRSVEKRDVEELRETRFIQADKFRQRTEVNIFGDSIAYIAHSEKEPFATVIENSTLAQEEKDKFELLWAMAK